VHLWFERKIPESADANIDQAEHRMIHADVAAAFAAIAAIADMAALESAEELSAFDKTHIFFFPQRERAHRRGGIAAAIFAMTVAHLQRFAAHLDLHRSAVTATFMCFSHEVFKIWKPGNQEDLNHEEGICEWSAATRNIEGNREGSGERAGTRPSSKGFPIEGKAARVATEFQTSKPAIESGSHEPRRDPETTVEEVLKI
jgi:hypothetical protein